MDQPFDVSVDDIDVEVTDTQNQVRFDPEDLKRLVRQVLAIEGVHRASISLALVDNATIREINRRHLYHDWPTDVITFPSSDAGDDLLVGEIVVSGEMARVSAHEIGEDAWDELALYVVHGLLHLRGYDDLDGEDAGTMRRRESEVLRLLGLKNTYPLADLLRFSADGPE